MNKELKVSFYLKRESRLEKNAVGENVIYPIIGKIIIGNSIAQFSTKLKIEERLWHVKIRAGNRKEPYGCQTQP